MPKKKLTKSERRRYKSRVLKMRERRVVLCRRINKIVRMLRADLARG